MDYKAIKPQLLKDLGFFLDGIEQLDLTILLEYHPGVGEKGQKGGLQAVLPSVFNQAFQDFAMPDVDPIKCTYGDYTGNRFIVIGKTLNG
jgi:hypothetical protein